MGEIDQSTIELFFCKEEEGGGMSMGSGRRSL